jgi:hypothetical protein
MTRVLALGLFLSLCVPGLARQEVLIVADEMPAMEVLARKLEAGASARVQLVTQTNLPTGLDRFSAVFVYIHRDLFDAPEHVLIQYARDGGKLVVLHHSISSGKRKNPDWFRFLGVELPTGDVRQGGYKWIEPARLEVVNLASRHYITTHGIKYPETFAFPFSSLGSASAALSKPGFVLPDSEVYLNHVLQGPREILLGFRYHDPTTGTDYAQTTAGWYRPAGRGWIFYYLPGHGIQDFENPVYAQILVNTLRFKPSAPSR